MGILTFHRSLAIVFLLVILLRLPFSLAYADDKPLQLYEQKIKAGLVYNLLKYTTWPLDSVSANGGTLNICLYGSDPFEGYLSPLQGRTAQQATIAISHIDQIDQIASCNIVIIHKQEENVLPVLLRSVQDKHILTISDIKEFTKRGGMVELAKEDEKINLYINKEAVDHAGLDIQERMLRLAKLVSG